MGAVVILPFKLDVVADDQGHQKGHFLSTALTYLEHFSLCH